ncbi:uncharacterized protein LOC113147284 [Cyclospora cayetanensis]|uniref:Elongation factor Ts, mitochondrial n=1 Tax=Cyclospora cayetanensis TaxID=88456 RepID=A0A6P6S0I6_9EIME|nr:uncharacterized protein LOC113147284 [Cyclospora cayetanensis]
MEFPHKPPAVDAPRAAAVDATEVAGKSSPGVPSQQASHVDAPVKPCAASPTANGASKAPANATSLVKQLRDRTSVSFGLCKQALEATEWDAEKAVLFLRKAGIARAAKTALRDAQEGVVSVVGSREGSSWSAVVLNCETDFVQRSPKFVAFSKALAEHCHSISSGDNTTQGDPGPTDTSDGVVSQLKSSQPSAQLSACAQSCSANTPASVQELLVDLATQFGENIVITAVERIDAAADSCIGAYVHGEIEAGVGTVAALVEIHYAVLDDTQACASLHKRVAELAKLLSMQVVATKPRFISMDSIPDSFVETERAIIEAAAQKKSAAGSSGGTKPVDLTKVIEKRLKHCLEEQCLLQQEFLMMGRVQNAFDNDGAGGEAHDPAEQRNRNPCTVADAIKFVGQRLGCKLEVSRMWLLSVRSV